MPERGLGLWQGPGLCLRIASPGAPPSAEDERRPLLHRLVVCARLHHDRGTALAPGRYRPRTHGDALMDTPAPDHLTSVEVLLEHQQARLADVRDRITRVVLQHRQIQLQLAWLDTRLDQLQQTLNRGTGRC